MRTPFIVTSMLIVIAGCVGTATNYDPLRDYEQVNASTILDAPTLRNIAPENAAAVVRGEYLVELLGCGACHTEGALIGEPDPRMSMAGSSIGIAYSNPLQNKNPGIVFAPNLTPDRDTGIGRWTDNEIIDAVRMGSGRHGPRRILVMPWQGYAKLTEDDAWAIVAYLRSMEPVENMVPAEVPIGRRSNQRFVHFGVYRSRELVPD